MTDLTTAKGLFGKRSMAIGLEILVNAVSPVVIYHFTADGLGDVGALLASMAPPLIWSVVEFLRSRRIDSLSVLVLAGIVLSLLAFVGTRSVRFLQLRENLVTGVIGLVFLGSVLIGRPLIYLLARAVLQRRSTEDLASTEALDDPAQSSRTFAIMTLVWGFGLIAQAALASVLVFNLSIANYLLVSPFVGYGTMGALGLWTLWFSREQE